MTAADPDRDRRVARAVLAAKAEGSPADGRLIVYLGFAPGVGKTYAMLGAVHDLRRQGRDAVVGFVETHGRAETAALLHGLEVIPRRLIEYQGVDIGEFDPEAAVARRPEVCAVDELAHSNAPGSPRRRRFEDVDVVLAAGIDVLTTLNIQHLESLNDVVASIAGVKVRERIPDAVLDRADEIILVDLSTDELRHRLEQGKVYADAAAAAKALENFFRAGNLNALRQLALTRTAQTVDRELDEYLAVHGIESPWRSTERVLACVDETAAGATVVRRAFRLANAERGEFLVVAVHPGTEPPGSMGDTLAVATDLGATVIARPGSGREVAREIIAVARQQRATLVVMGPSHRTWWERLWGGDIIDRVITALPDVDVLVLGLGGD
ncbi:MAG: universal stress protein [Actinomycetota bacterium]|nr:universal stress protein [Actinomycetota bacterium]